MTTAGLLSLRARALLLLGLLAAMLGVAGAAALASLNAEADEFVPRSLALVTLLLAALGLPCGWWIWGGLWRQERARQLAAARLLRFHRAMSATSRLVLRRPTHDTLFEEVCKVWAGSEQLALAVVYLLDGPQARRVAIAGASAWRSAASDGWPLNSAEADPSLTMLAIRSGHLAISNDVTRDARLRGWQPRLAAQGVHALAALPLKRGGVPYGALLLVAQTPDFFDIALADLLSEAADDISFAIDNADREIASRTAQEQTQNARQLFEALFRTAPVAMAVMSLRERRVLKINDRWGALLGRDCELALGKTIDELDFVLDAETWHRFYDTLRRTGSVAGMHAQVTMHTGFSHELLLHAEQVAYRDEPCVLAVATDISDLQAAQVAERARAVAVEANRAKTEFLSQMSHELRTPLNAVLGFAQLLAADDAAGLGPAQAEWVRLISQAGWHLLALVDDVLDFSRIESGRLQVVTQCVELAPLLDEMLSLTRPLARTNRVGLGGDFAGLAGHGALADPRRLRQVMINVLSNAIKYNRPGGRVEVRVSVSPPTVAIEVEDDGLGMTDEQLAHLFEPFNRLGRQHGHVEGAGIGLALSRQLIVLMGGQLAVHRTDAGGTLVRVTLAACAAGGAALSGADVPADAPDAPAPVGLVLYIEDNPVNTLMVEQMLLRWKGVRLLQADCGAAGIEMALAQQPDLVLLDMQLPDMSGFEVLRALRDDPRGAALRVVALSASAMQQDVEQAAALDVLDYLTKPLELTTFLAKVSALLRR